jgi:hypothetical protein
VRHYYSCLISITLLTNVYIPDEAPPEAQAPHAQVPDQQDIPATHPKLDNDMNINVDDGEMQDLVNYIKSPISPDGAGVGDIHTHRLYKACVVLFLHVILSLQRKRWQQSKLTCECGMFGMHLVVE